MLAVSTLELVKRVSENPGCEDQRFEYKRREKVGSTPGRRDLVRSICSMANQEGGVILLGLAVENNDLTLQDFDPADETPRDLALIAHERTRPSAQRLFDARFEKVHGKRLIRIDVWVSRRPVEYREDTGLWVTPLRVGSSTQLMDASHAFDRGQQSARTDRGRELFPILHPAASPARNRRTILPWDGRFVTESDGDYHLVFTEILPVEAFDAAALIHVESPVNLSGASEISRLIEALQNSFGKSPYQAEDFSYSLQVGPRTIVGTKVRHLLEDAASVDSILHSVQNMHTEPLNYRVPKSEWRPVLAACRAAGGGLFWFEAEYYPHLGEYMFGQCGFVLENVPFDDSAMKRFFKEVGASPSDYSQSTRIDGFQLMANHKLARPRPQRFGQESEPGLFVQADNPFFGRKEELVNEHGHKVPDYLFNGITSCPRLLWQVAGGAVASDKGFEMRQIAVLRKGLRIETHFVNALCFANR